uniref:phage tail protein n=1 Tax=Gemmiger formicilis TaxID=745368 RepID=UPI003FEE9368
LAIDVMNGIRHNLTPLQKLASTLADVATKGVTVLGDALQSAMPYIQNGLDYLNQNGEKVAKILAGVAGAFAAMSIAPQAEMAAKGVGGVVKGGAGLLGSAINVVAGNPTGNAKQSIGSALLGRITGGVANAGSAVTNAQNFVAATGNTSGAGVGTLWALLKNKIAGGNNAELLQQAAMTPGLLNYMPTMRQSIAQNPIVQKVTGTVGAVAGGVGNYLGGVGTSAKGFAKSQWNLAGGMANGAVAGISGIGQFINAAVGLPGAPANPGQGTGAALAAAGKQMLGGAGGMITNGAAGLVQAVAPFASAFGGIASAALPMVAVIGSIVAAVSILGDHLDDIRGIIGNVFGENGVAVFDGFLNTITTVKDRIVGIFSPENLASVRTAIVGMFGENAGTGFDNIVSIGQSVIGVFQQIVNFGTQTVKPMFEQVFGWVSTTLLPGLLNAFNAIAPQIGPLVTNIGTAVMNVATLIGNAIQTILPVIENIVMVLVNVVATVAPPIIAAVSQIFANISNVVMSLQGIFDGLIQFITGVFTGNWASAWEGVKSIFGNAFSALVELCKVPINAVIGVINGAIRGINSIVGGGVTIPDWLPGGGGTFSLHLNEIPMLAKGGFTDGVSIAGEAGTEAVISFDPSVRSANIANWQKAGQMLGVDPVQAASVAGAGSLTTDRVEVADIGGGSPAPGGTTAVGGGSFTFSPNITIQGNADYNVMMNAMTDAKDQFEQWFNEMMRKQQRTAYAR